MIERISHYRIVVRIGRGAMGEVYHAIDERLGRPVALKLLPASVSDSAESQARLLREAQAASALNHPGIVTVHDVGAWEGRVFMVMELVDGERFTEVARAGIALGDSLALAAQVADALGVAHARSIFHRDVKSDNLMRTRDGRAKVLDFGLAKLLDEVPHEHARVITGESPRLDNSDAHALTLAPATPDVATAERSGSQTSLAEELESSERAQAPVARSSSTLAGSVFGTPAYMSPEQADGAAVDATSEVFSLGVVLYELVTGARPFRGASVEETLEAIRSAPIAPPSRAAPTRKIPAFVDAVVLRALERDRERRFADMPAFGAAMRAARARLASGRGALPLAGAVLAGAIAIGAGVALSQRHHAAPVAPKITTVRRITFDSGCEEFPSFLPDDHTLLYDGLAGDDYEIYSLDLATGTRTRLTTLPGWDWGARASPDGKMLAWEHNGEDGGQVAVKALPDGAPRLLGATSGVPGWTPEGALLAGTSDGTRVERVSLADDHRTPLFAVKSTGPLTNVTPFSGDRTLVVFQDVRDTLSTGVFDASGRMQHAVPTLPMHSVGVAIGPDQRAYYYTRMANNAHELVRHALDDDSEVPVTGGATPVTLAFAHDGKHLVYSTCSDFESIVHIEPDGRATKLIGGETSRDHVPRVIGHGWIVFGSDRAGANQIWVFDPAAQTYRAITTSASNSPTVSPDGRSVAYVDEDRGGLSLSPIEGGAARSITSDRTDAYPAFTHDGSALVYVRTTDHARIWTVGADGAGARSISAPGASSPAASPVEDLVLFLQRVDGHTRIMRTTLAPGATPSPLDVDLPSGDLDALVVSADGKHVAMTRNAQEIVEVALAPGSRWRSRWKTPTDAVQAVSYDASGKSFVVSLTRWEGDLWLADGDFP